MCPGDVCQVPVTASEKRLARQVRRQTPGCNTPNMGAACSLSYTAMIEAFSQLAPVRAALGGTGFVLGMIRVPLLVPRLGERLSELMEMPFMFVAIVLSARFIMGRFNLPGNVLPRLGTGFLALFALMPLVLARGTRARHL